MDSTLNASCKACAKIDRATCSSGLGVDRFHHALGKEAAEDFPNANWTDARALVERYKVTCHHCTVGHKWQGGVSQPVHP